MRMENGLTPPLAIISFWPTLSMFSSPSNVMITILLSCTVSMSHSGLMHPILTRYLQGGLRGKEREEGGRESERGREREREGERERGREREREREGERGRTGERGREGEVERKGETYPHVYMQVQSNT